MSSLDTFPLDPDFTIPEEGTDGVARTPALSKKRGKRIVEPDARIWSLVFAERSTDEVEQIRDWYERFKHSYFIFNHKIYNADAGAYVPRKFPVEFGGRPRYSLDGHELTRIELQLIEAVGATMQSADYPDPAAPHPSHFFEEEEAGIAQAVAGTWTQTANANAHAGEHATNPNSNTTDAFQFTYGGYGFRLWAMKASNLGIFRVYLDGVDLGTIDLYNASTLAAAVVLDKRDVPLGLHRVKIEATNTKNASSSANTIAADAIEVFP